ncbi:TerS protein [Variovorax sp. PBL-H6]|uniref:TerS protein n=1 Tax=Variovorax sp. PBL-H6 TaxID=434009 RepID=UPI0013A5B6FB|nr:TerS protein [Variovorax sp. PBL-H6]
MKMTPRRKRSDSAAAAVAAAQAVALGPIDPPAHVTLRPGDRPFWDAIVTARARDTWTQTDLATAANLARAQADIETLQAQLDAAGYLIEGKANPLAAMVETLSRRAVALSRVLHVHAQATVGRSEDAAKALDNERKAAADHDPLIPTLRVVGG